jgi:hypothetical protein
MDINADITYWLSYCRHLICRLMEILGFKIVIDKAFATSFESAIECETEGNVEMMRYHLIQAANDKVGSAAYKLAMLFQSENKNDLYIKYMDMGCELGDYDSRHEKIAYLLLKETNLNCVVLGINQMIALMKCHQNVTCHMDSIFDRFEKIPIIRLDRCDRYGNYHFYHTCDDYIQCYLLMHQLLCDSMHTGYRPRLLISLMNAYRLVKARGPTGTWGISADVCKLIDIIPSYGQDTFLWDSNSLVLPRIKSYLLCMVTTDIRSALTHSSTTHLNAMKDFCSDVIADETLYMECCRVMGTRYKK